MGEVKFKIGNGWDNVLGDEFNKKYYINLRNILKKEYSSQRIYPDMYDIYNALRLTDYNDVKAVILGQDPYHGYGQAHGLCFSVKRGVEPPPSLKNIFKELNDDLGIEISESGELTSWAKNGVLLLNTALTVREGKPNSHRGLGWEIFTDRVISLLNERQKPVAFILWGANAKEKVKLITNIHHGIFTAAHPSPLSAYNGFFGCKHFSKVNEFLKKNNIEPIDWNLK